MILKNALTKSIAAFLIFVFLLGSAAFALPINQNDGYYYEPPEIHTLGQNIAIDQQLNEIQSDSGATISEAREKYNLLLGGNYRSVEIPYRFRELFGDMTQEYILANYTSIFDITSDEMDQAFVVAL